MNEQTETTKKMLGEYELVEESSSAQGSDLSGKGLPIGRLGTNNPGVEGRRDTNDQLYNNSSLSGSETERNAIEGEDALFNTKMPNLVINREQPIHRLICYLKAAGLSNKEIAEKTGKSQPWISQVVRQPWAQERITQELRLAGRDAVQGLLRVEAENSVWTLIEVRDNAAEKGATRIGAANSILDRLYGRPNQPITHGGKLDMSKLGDEELLRLVSEGGVTSGGV